VKGEASVAKSAAFWSSAYLGKVTEMGIREIIEKDENVR
jgi:hypothetical protein